VQKTRDFDSNINLWVILNVYPEAVPELLGFLRVDLSTLFDASLLKTQSREFRGFFSGLDLAPSLRIDEAG
jgi:hypothetical protein